MPPVCGFISLPTAGASKVTVSELCDALLEEYKLQERRSIPPVRAHLKRICEEFGDMRATDLRSKHLHAYQVMRKAEHAAGSTINRELGLLRRAIRRFLEEQRLPVPRYEMLPENIRCRHRAGLPAFYTGWRLGEIARLKWADVDEESMTVKLSWRKSKNKQGRTMTLTGELANIVKRAGVARAERLVAGHDWPYVFVRSDGRVRATKSRGRPVGDIHVVWNRACKEAGLEGRLFHDLRRSAARNMDRAGVSRHVAMQITEHKTEAMYRRYNIVNDADIKAAMEKTADDLDSLPTKAR